MLSIREASFGPVWGSKSITNLMIPGLNPNMAERILSRNNLSAERDENMGSNDLCVCGSGKALTECHKTLHRNSKVALLWQKYRNIADETERLRTKHNVKFRCSKGFCNKCCDSYFYVSALEYFLIKNHIIDLFGQGLFRLLWRKANCIMMTWCYDIQKKRIS